MQLQSFTMIMPSINGVARPITLQKRYQISCLWLGKKKSLSISGILRFAEEIISSIFLEEPNLNFQLYYKPTLVDNACQESINKIN